MTNDWRASFDHSDHQEETFETNTLEEDQETPTIDQVEIDEQMKAEELSAAMAAAEAETVAVKRESWIQELISEARHLNMSHRLSHAFTYSYFQLGQLRSPDASKVRKMQEKLTKYMEFQINLEKNLQADHSRFSSPSL